MLHQCRGSVGEGIIEKLSEELTGKYGKGFDKRSLYRYVQFYQMYPEIVGTVTPQSRLSDKKENVGAVTPQSGQYSIFIENRRINELWGELFFYWLTIVYISDDI